MRFFVTVESDDFALLNEHFPEEWSPDVWFDQDDEGAAFMSLSAADGESDASKRQETAIEVLRRAWGLLTLLESPRGHAELTGTQEDAEGRRHHVVQVESVIAVVSVGTPTILMNGVPVDEHNPPPQTPDLLELGERNPVVAEMLDLVGKSDFNWIDLYKVYEIVAHEVGGVYGIERNGWATKRKLSAFTASANRKDVSGDGARHARAASSELPKETMTLNEARVFIRTLATDWIRHRSALDAFSDEDAVPEN